MQPRPRRLTRKPSANSGTAPGSPRMHASSWSGVTDRPKDHTATIEIGWPCPYCGDKPKGIQISGKYLGMQNPYYIASHTCKGGTSPAGYEYSMLAALHEYWGPWVKGQPHILSEPKSVPVVKRSLWDKLWNG